MQCLRDILFCYEFRGIYSCLCLLPIFPYYLWLCTALTPDMDKQSIRLIVHHIYSFSSTDTTDSR